MDKKAVVYTELLQRQLLGISLHFDVGARQISGQLKVLTQEIQRLATMIDESESKAGDKGQETGMDDVLCQACGWTGPRWALCCSYEDARSSKPSSQKTFDRCPRCDSHETEAFDNPMTAQEGE